MSDILKKRLIKAENDNYTEWVNNDVGETYETKDPVSLSKWDSMASEKLTDDYVADYIIDSNLLEDVDNKTLSKEDVDDIAEYAIAECIEPLFGACLYEGTVPKQREHDKMETLFPKTFEKARNFDYTKALESAREFKKEIENYND